MSVIEADWLQTSYASSRRPRVATRLAPTVRAPSMRLRSESLTGPRGSATGRRDPAHSGARPALRGCSHDVPQTTVDETSAGRAGSSLRSVSRLVSAIYVT